MSSSGVTQCLKMDYAIAVVGGLIRSLAWCPFGAYVREVLGVSIVFIVSIVDTSTYDTGVLSFEDYCCHGINY